MTKNMSSHFYCVLLFLSTRGLFTTTWKTNRRMTKTIKFSDNWKLCTPGKSSCQRELIPGRFYLLSGIFGSEIKFKFAQKWYKKDRRQKIADTDVLVQKTKCAC